MGRYADIPNAEIACSGVLGKSIHNVIGAKRYQESVIVLSKQEVFSVMENMIKLLGYECSLNYQLVLSYEKDYGKLSEIMLWYHDIKDTDKLTFS